MSNLATRERLFRKLERAMLEHRYTRFIRSIDGADVIDGYVVALGDDWALVATFVGALTINGWEAIRLRDIANVKSLPSRGNVDAQERVLRAKGAWPPITPVMCDMSSAASIISTGLQLSRVVEIHREKKDAWGFLVGAPINIGPGEITIHKVNRNAEWSDIRSVTVKSITRIGIGGDYVSNLDLILKAKPSG